MKILGRKKLGRRMQEVRKKGRKIFRSKKEVRKNEVRKIGR